MKKCLAIVLTTVVFLATSQTADAYLDPVSISFVVQGIVGAVAAVIASVRSVREGIAGFFRNLFGKKVGTDSDSRNDE